MSTRKELAQKVIAIVIIFIMTFADFAIIGINAISYAIDMTITNNDNVQFCAYFVDENKQQLSEIDSIINAKDVKVYLEVSVKNEGYFNGQISLEDTSFEFIHDKTKENEFIKEMDEKTIKLNQINAGVTAKIEVAIRYIDGENIELQGLSKENKINLTGIYKNSKKDIEITGETTLKINWKSQEKLNTKIGAKVLTNKIYEIQEEQKRIVQLLVDSKLENDLYPIKNTNLKLNVPQVVESVKVHSRNTNATNGNTEFNEKNYSYDSETGILEINIQNQEKDGKISWIKDEKDSLVITYIYPKDVDIEKQEINLDSVITTYDDKEVTANCKVIIDKEINGVLTSKINLDETQIYKGKLYTTEDRYYTTSTSININYALMDEIRIEEKEAVFITNNSIQKANIQYVQTRINREEFNKIFGQEGNITILDQDGNTIANINKDTEVDENGYININYDSGVKAITINTTKPQTEETLHIYNRKVILDNKYTRKDISEFTGIKEEISNGYNLNDVKTIELKDTESTASIEVSTNKFSALEENKNIEIVATLETNNESKDLYKNPSVDVIFPKEISQVEILSAKALYRNGLKVEKCEKIKNQDGNTILHIDFEGEQKKYNSEILNGLEIHIYANLTLDKTTPNKISEFILNYTNDNGSEDLYSVSKQINIESQDGLVLYNSISDYNKKNEKIELIDQEQTTAELDMNSKETTAKIETVLINNYDKDITEDIIVIGDIPVKDNENTFTAKISNLKVNDKSAEVKYGKDRKAYKVVLDKLDSGEVVKISYDISIPAKLSYNEKGVLATSLQYSYEEKDISDISNIILETEIATIEETLDGVTTTTKTGLEVNIKTSSGNKALNDGDEIYNGETVTYALTVKNNTGNDLNDVDVKVTQTNGVMFELVERQVYNPAKYEGEGYGMEHFWEETKSNIKEFNDIDIPNGESVTLDEYQVVVKKGDSTELYGNISFKSKDNTLDETIKTIKNSIKDAELKLTFVPKDSEEFHWDRNKAQYLTLSVTNMTEQELKDIDLQITLSEELSCEKYEKYQDYLILDNDIEFKDKQINGLGQTIITLSIKLLLGKGIKNIEILPIAKDFDEESKIAHLYAQAITVDNNIYNSNNVEKKIYYGEKNSDLKLTQVAKVNNVIADSNTMLKNQDKVEFYIGIENLNNEEVDISIESYIASCWKDFDIELIKDNNKTNITEKVNIGRLSIEDKIGAKDMLYIKMLMTFDSSNINEESIVHTINVTDLSYLEKYINECKINIAKSDDNNLNLKISQISNPEDKSIISDKQKVEFIVNIENICNYDRKVNIVDSLNLTLKNIKVFINDNEVTDKYLTGNELKIDNYVVKAKQKVVLRISGTVDLSGYEGETISNSVLIKSDYPDVSSNIITYYVQHDSSNDDNKQSEYSVSGVAWLDSNGDGKRDDEEEYLKDLEIRAINTKTEEVLNIKTQTNEDGSYQLVLPKGKYIIVFMYDNDNYYVTTYHADNVDGKVNSDAVSKSITIDNKEEIYGITDEISLTSNKENIDIGLVSRSKFDLQLEKYITKVVVINDKKTKTYNFDKITLGKVEIDSKYLSDSTVLVEYTLKVTNIGDIQGSVKDIIDYKPADMKFSSDLNKDWYQSEEYLHNEVLSNKTLDKGEFIETKIILTKKMTDSNTGLVNNTATLKFIENIDSVTDVNKENNKGSADLIISVKTGTALRFTLLVFSLTVSLIVVAYYGFRRYKF